MKFKTEEDSMSLERVQKVAFRIILKSEYLTYANALKVLQLQRLEERRTLLCLKFAKKCVRHPIASMMFPLNKPQQYETRKYEKYYVQPGRTSRLKHSSIPQMQRLLNLDAQKTKAK